MQIIEVRTDNVNVVGMTRGKQCPAFGYLVKNARHALNHFANVCRTKGDKQKVRKKKSVRRVSSSDSSASDSDDSDVCHIEVVGNVTFSTSSTATLSIGGPSDVVLYKSSTG